MQGRDPFSGDCDRRGPPRRLRRDGPALQGRDPFSGDCDPGHPPGGGAAAADLLQGRDPFSGDCDSAGTRRSTRIPRRRLAGTRPVFRGLRPPPARRPAAAARPDLQGRDPFSGDCDQVAGRRHHRGRGLACRDETRFQGIATSFLLRHREGGNRMAGLQGRDPFSGDCDHPCHMPRMPGQEGSDLQGRDPFSGDCDLHRDGRALLEQPGRGLQGRDPFSGDCDARSASERTGRTRRPCRDETRFQGIAT